MKFIRKFMIVFGLLNSVADYSTFGALLYFGSTQDQFRTGWFIENVFSAALIVLAMRTSRPLIKSRPGKYLVLATVTIICIVFVIPYTIVGREFGFTPISVSLLVLITIVVAVYTAIVEIVKKAFYRRVTM